MRFAAKFFICVMIGLVSPNLLAAVSTTKTKTESSKANLLSFYFQHIEIRTLLQLIAKSSGMNFIISDAVKGDITINLTNVTWRQALDIVMQAHGLGSKQIGNVMFISTIEEITGNETKKFQSEQTLATLVPLTTTLVHLKYTNASEMAKILQGSAGGSLLTPRGQVAVDNRTNSIIIRDERSNLNEALKAIYKLDVPARQVLIEARVVSIDIDYEKQIGARFGLSKPQHLSGTLAGANELAGGAPVTSVDPIDRLNFNVPASNILSNPAGSIALAVARLGGFFIDAELSALEMESHANVISRPRVITSNQQKAIIQAGTQIPYEQSTSSGATSVAFQNAVLSLEITPQITPNNRIILDVKVHNDSVSSTTNGSAGPAIDTQSVASNVLLNDNETVVIGGIYQDTKTNEVDRIPFLGTLPVVGNFFSHKGEKTEKKELLIFLTPRIISSSVDLYKGDDV